MSNLAIKLDEVALQHRLAPQGSGRSGPLRCILMDDSRFDRRYLRSIAEQSKFDIDFIETSTIAETRAAMQGDAFDMLMLDYRVPDGDGIDFAKELRRDQAHADKPVIVVTGEGSETAAINALRSGAADYLSKDDITADVFDQAVENALSRAAKAGTDQSERLTELLEENSALRRASITNMRLLKGQTLPLLSFAWRSVQGSTVADDARDAAARRLEKLTRNMSGLIDDTVITAATYQASQGDEAVDLIDLIAEIRAKDVGEIKASNARINVGDLPPIRGVRAHMAMMFEELILTAVRSGRLGSVPEIDISAAQDGEGNPIIVFAENGLHLSARRQTLNQKSEGLDPSKHGTRHDALAWSLCQRLAEKCGGVFRIADNPEGGVRIMIRFPRSHLAKPDPV